MGMSFQHNKVKHLFAPFLSAALALCASLALAQPSNVYVDDDWAALLPGAEPEPGKIIGTNAFAVVHDGYDAVTTGGTVHIAPGLYDFSKRQIVDIMKSPSNPDPITCSLLLNKAVRLLGPQFGIDPRPIAYPSTPNRRDETSPLTEAILDGSLQGDSEKPQSLIVVFADDVYIDGLVIKSGTKDLVFSGKPLEVPIYNTQIRYCVVKDSTTDEGIQLKAARNALLEFNYVHDTQGDCLNISVAPLNAVIRFNQMSFSNSLYGGIYAYDTSNSPGQLNYYMQGNVINDVLGQKGAGLCFGADGTQDNNVRGGILKDNIIFNCYDGIRCNMSDVLIEGNEIYNCANARDGIIAFKYPVNNITIRNNKVHDNFASYVPTASNTCNNIGAISILNKAGFDFSTWTVENNEFWNNKITSPSAWSSDFGTGTGSWTSGASEAFLPTPSSGGGKARVRVGTQGGSFNLDNPATIGSGSELRGVAPTSTSYNKFSTYDYTPAKAFRTKFKVKFTGGSSGTWAFFQGDGATFSDDNAGAATQTFTGIRWVFGAAGAITTNYLSASTWTLLPTVTFQQDTVYTVEIVGNNSTATINYKLGGADYSVAANKWDLFVNGTRVAALAKSSLAADKNVDSFMFTGYSSTGNVAKIILDDIDYSNLVSGYAIYNARFVATSDPADRLTAQNCYFGDTSGPNDDEAIIQGSGDRISYGVDVVPFLYYKQNFIPDTDGDGINDQIEKVLGTDYENKDTDGDGIEDGIEWQMGYTTSNPDDTPPDPPSWDVDTDGDGFTDAYEVAKGTDPNNPADKPLMGDVNLNGRIDNIDAIIVFQISLGVLNLNQFISRVPDMDVNRDGQITYVDAVIIFDYFLGIRNQLPAI